MRSIHELGDEYSWDYEESLEDALGITSPYDLDVNILCEDKDNEKKFVAGDILMVPNGSSSVSGRNSRPHRVVVINSVENKDGTTTYSGYVLSSKVEKANKNNEKFPNNIYIKNYDSILKYGKFIGDKEVILKVDEVITFKNIDLSDHGTWKGHVSDEFFDFIMSCAENFKKDKTLNKYVFWEK